MELSDVVLGTLTKQIECTSSFLTYKWISRILRCNFNVGKALLEQFCHWWKANKCKSGSEHNLNIVYLVVGRLNKFDATFKVVLTQEANLSQTTSLFAAVDSCSIYGICIGQPNLTALVDADVRWDSVASDTALNAVKYDETISKHQPKKRSGNVAAAKANDDVSTSRPGLSKRPTDVITKIKRPTASFGASGCMALSNELDQHAEVVAACVVNKLEKFVHEPVAADVPNVAVDKRGSAAVVEKSPVKKEATIFVISCDVEKLKSPAKSAASQVNGKSVSPGHENASDVPQRRSNRLAVAAHESKNIAFDADLFSVDSSPEKSPRKAYDNNHQSSPTPLTGKQSSRKSHKRKPTYVNSDKDKASNGSHDRSDFRVHGDMDDGEFVVEPKNTLKRSKTAFDTPTSEAKPGKRGKHVVRTFTDEDGFLVTKNVWESEDISPSQADSSSETEVSACPSSGTAACKKTALPVSSKSSISKSAKSPKKSQTAKKSPKKMMQQASLLSYFSKK